MRPHHILLSDRLFCCPDAWVPLSRRQFDKFSNHWNKAGGVRTLDTRGGKKRVPGVFEMVVGDFHFRAP